MMSEVKKRKKSAKDQCHPCPLPHGRWEPIPEMTDEFDGNELDISKWIPCNPSWVGRQPAYFNPNNLTVRDGMLHLTAKMEDLPNMPPGYNTYTTAAVQSTTKVRYGYFEIRARVMNSEASSAFWFYDVTPEVLTEIDVFETGARKYPHNYFMTTHVWHTLVEADHWSEGKIWEAPYNLGEEFHVYGFEWDRDEMKFYVDGKVVRQDKNTHFHQALTLNFDSETMPNWFGLPDKMALPATFSIDYIRAWKRLDGPPDDKIMTCEFRWPGREDTCNQESAYRLKTDGPGTLVVKALGGAERPYQVLLDYQDEKFFAEQTEKEIRKKVTIQDVAGKKLSFLITWSKEFTKRVSRTHPPHILQMSTPNGYRPVHVDILPEKPKPRGISEVYFFQAEDGTAIRVTIRH